MAVGQKQNHFSQHLQNETFYHFWSNSHDLWSINGRSQLRTFQKVFKNFPGFLAAVTIFGVLIFVDGHNDVHEVYYVRSFQN